MKLSHLLVCSVFTFFVLYAPQPILPLLSAQFAVSPASIGSLMTATMVPLAIAPLFYGFILTRFCALTILKSSFIVLAISCILFSFATSFEQLMAIRIVQGLLLPACLTAMTSYLANRHQGKTLTRVMSWYVLSTIAGGFLARISSALVTQYWHWHGFYWVLCTVLLLLGLSITAHSNKVTSRKQSVVESFSSLFSGKLRLLYLSVFCMFFCFTALLNYLPFILKNDYLMTSTKNIGLVYSGYLLGAVFCSLTPLLLKKAKSSARLLIMSFVIYNLAIVSLISQSFIVFFVGFTLFCAAMFVIHSVAAPYVNQLSDAPSSLTNGFYVSFYYSGGAIGSFLPGLLYQSFGKTAFLLCLLCVCLVGLSLVLLMRQK